MTARSDSQPVMPPGRSLHWRDITAVLCVAGVIMLVLAMVSYDPQDAAWSYVASVPVVRNRGGVVGAWMADILFSSLGRAAWWLPIAFLGWAGRAVFNRANPSLMGWTLHVQRLIGHALILLAGAALASVITQAPVVLPSGPGGWMGDLIAWYGMVALGMTGVVVVLVTYVVLGLMLVTQLTPLDMIWRCGLCVLTIVNRGLAVGRWLRRVLCRTAPSPQVGSLASKSDRSLSTSTKPTTEAHQVRHQRAEVSKETIDKKPVTQVTSPSGAAIQALKVPGILSETKNKAHDSKLTTALLAPDELSDKRVAVDEHELEIQSQHVESKLQDFGIQARVVAVHPGPVITRYELQLAAGTKVSKITSLDKDLARSLSVVSVRVVEVIAGKSVIGLELPNSQRLMVRFRSVLESPAYREHQARLPLALGRDIQGQPVVTDLAKMPHLLVAGTTGSGKSVGINGMILSLLFALSPQELRLIMIDPKMLELSVYNGIGHLLTPVVTDMAEAAGALQWCVGEMERRYRLMAALGVRQLTAYNDKISAAVKAGQPIEDPFQIREEGEPCQYCQPLPAIVVVVDEFADMIMVVGKKVEQLIARIAQKARAAGIHLILATQRPSVDVITGLIKANVPARISFQVSSRIDSRTILDQQGAEQLLGHGDMLYLKPGSSLPVRVHGAFVADEEVHRVVAAIKQTFPEPAYDDEICTGGSEADDGDARGDRGDCDDPLYDEAVAFVCQAQRVSISSVQRRFRIGYNRAANLVEAMEMQGVVSTAGDGGGREVLLSRED